MKLCPPPRQKPVDADTSEAYVPEGFREGDNCFTVTAVDDTHAEFGFYAGDVGVVYTTRDVTSEDLAAVRIDGVIWLGRYRPAPGGYMTFERREELRTYKPSEAALEGRVCHVERRGEIVRQFRPIREGGRR